VLFVFRKALGVKGFVLALISRRIDRKSVVVRWRCTTNEEGYNQGNGHKAESDSSPAACTLKDWDGDHGKAFPLQ
jgi:hypothetical protein